MEIGIASLFANILALAPPIFVIQVLNRYIAHGVDATLVTLTSGALLAVGLEFVFRLIRGKLARAVSEQTDAEISVAGYGILVLAKAGALGRLPVGQRRQVISAAQNVETAYGSGNISAVFDVPFSLLFIGVLYLLSPTLSGVAGAFLVFVYAAGRIGAHYHQKLSRQLIREASTANMLVNTASEHIDTVRAYNNAGFLYRSWMNLFARSLGMRKSAEAILNLISILSQSSAALMSIAMITIAATMVVGGNLDVGTMIGANILAARALAPIAKFAQLSGVFASAVESLAVLKEFSTLPTESNTGSIKSEYTGNLEFKDLAYLFPGASTPLFENFNLNIKPNTIVVICGANGTGKSTLARLIAGILEPVRGQILVDGLDLQQASLAWWRRQIAYLPQEPALINATIRENLTIPNPQVDEAILRHAIKVAGLETYFDESFDGIDAKVINNGTNLSPGIRRRIALARALLSECKLAVFDEPTDGLDREGVASVYGAIDMLVRRGCTILMISHDPKIIKGAQVVVDLNAKPVPRISERSHAFAKPKEVS